MKPIPGSLIGLFLVLVLAFLVHAEAPTSVSSSVLANGGAPMEDDQYRMVGTVGQSVIGRVSTSSYLHHVGFWPTAEEAAPSEEVLTGDMDGDGKVGIPDFFIFAAAFGCSAEDACYHSVADLDGDGKIGIPDFFIFASHFGESREKLAALAWELLGISMSPRLHQNHPNPFNPVTILSYGLPQASSVALSIYTITGQEAVTLVSGEQQAGQYEVIWDASGYANGVYLYRLETESFVETKRMLLLK